MIAVLNTGLNNVGSILNMLKKLEASAFEVTSGSELSSAKKIILPGVGSFDMGMQRLRARGFLEVLNEKVLEEKIPLLGICLGMQLLGQESEEGTEKGLGWLPASVKRFSFSLPSPFKVPHMGWNCVTPCHSQSRLFQTDSEGEPWRFYFVHSFHFHGLEAAKVAATTSHGIQFPSAVEHENIYGVQFHPEKSHRYGLKLLKNFLENTH